MTPLERRCRWLLLAYPAWYRRRRGEEMLGTLLAASRPGGRWPSFRDARALITGGLRVRGWVWLLSMLWVVAGAANTGYFFYLTTKPFTWADVNLGIPGRSADPQAVQIAIALATFAWLALPVPVLIAGFIRLRGWRPRNGLRAAAWAGGWIAGVALLSLAAVWGQYPQDCPNGPLAPQPQCPLGSPAVVSWGELPICAAWLALGAVLTWILAMPAHHSDVPDTRGSSALRPTAKRGQELRPLDLRRIAQAEHSELPIDSAERGSAVVWIIIKRNLAQGDAQRLGQRPARRSRSVLHALSPRRSRPTSITGRRPSVCIAAT